MEPRPCEALLERLDECSECGRAVPYYADDDARRRCGRCEKVVCPSCFENWGEFGPSELCGPCEHEARAEEEDDRHQYENRHR